MGSGKNQLDLLWSRSVTQKAFPFSFSGDVFSQWTGTMEETSTRKNYVGVLAAGWCYVLSAWLVEVQGDGAGMRYTDSRADVGSTTKVENASERTHSIDLGEEASADAKTVRWWSAILAKGEGWNAVVQEGRLDGDAFVTP